MTSFDARLRVVGQTGLPLGVEIDLTTERMTVAADGTSIADWDLNDIRIAPTPSGYRIDAEGETVIVAVNDDERFLSEIQSRLVEL